VTIKNEISGVEHARNQECIHRVNVKNGWFDKPVTFLECMALLITEVVEVNDAYEAEGLIGGAQDLRGGWLAPSRMASEFADCYIRLADCASRFMADLGVDVDIYRHSYRAWEQSRSFSGTMMQLIRRVRDAIEAYRVEGLIEDRQAGEETRRHLAYFFLQLQDTCDELAVDLRKVVDLKMMVNDTRGYRHGGKHA
jgi:hypothetical protein